MKERPSAVICSNDMTAIGVLHTTQRLGRRIPDEMSLIGFDDLLMSQIVQPALTTLHHSRQQIAARAFTSLQMGGGSGRDGTTSFIQPRLNVRSSTGRKS